MAAAYFEEHPTDPDKVILRKRPCPYCSDTPRTWVGLTDEEIKAFDTWHDNREEEVGWCNPSEIVAYIEAKLKEKNT
jgi:glutaredoxin